MSKTFENMNNTFTLAQYAFNVNSFKVNAPLYTANLLSKSKEGGRGFLQPAFFRQEHGIK